MILSRSEFRNSVFKRDGNKCVVCKELGQDAHHIIERRLFSNGGYYINNGVTLCGKCHILAEKTDISVEFLLNKIDCKRILPEHLYDSETYDKWGNLILPNGFRLKGELFYDESVQKILKDKICLFVDYFKYPRTYHLPWSNPTKDDRVIQDDSELTNGTVIVTLKMDGENTSLYRHGIHARSLDYSKHPSRSWMKKYHSEIQGDIPEDWRICGENLFAKHSIKYLDLESYFYGFSIWEKDVCLDWDTTLDYFQLFGITPVKEIYRGEFNKEKIENSFSKYKNSHEGYVVRKIGNINYSNFRNEFAKYVRNNHVTSSSHWFYSRVEKNNIKSIDGSNEN